MIYLSIVIPVRNEESFITDTLKALARQNYPKECFEVLVVDGGSTDCTRLAVNRFIGEYPEINIRLYDNVGHLSSCARNIGIREAKGRLVGIIDGHVYIPNDHLLANMERISKERKALCLARPAPLEVPGLTEGKAYWIAVARKTCLGHSRKSFIYSDFEGFVDPGSSGFAYERSVFDLVGYFDERFDAAEDLEFHFRLKKAGIMAYTSPDLLIYSYPRESFWELFRQQVRYGKGRAQFVRKHSQGFSKETLVPPSIFLFFVTLPIITVFFWKLPLIIIACSSGLFVYCTVLLTSGLAAALARKRFVPGALVAFGVWTTHMGLGWGFLKTILRLRLS